MMTQRNIELQLQALDMVERKHLTSTASNSLDDSEIDNRAGTSSADVSIDKPIFEHEHEHEKEVELDDVIQEDVK